MSLLGTTIDEMFRLEQQITKAEAALKVLKQERAKLEARLLLKFEGDEIEGTRTKLAIAGVKKHKSPTINNRDKVNRYVERTGDLDLFQNRIMSKHYFELLEDGEKVPGVEVFTRTSVSITKRR